MRILLTGSAGQLGQAIRRNKPDLINKNEIDFLALNRKEFDLSDPILCTQKILDLRPDWVINSGAYTSVDKAEDEPLLAMKVNSHAPEAIAIGLKQTGGKLIQLSTDFVFSGEQGTPYKTSDKKNPLNIYGKSKATAEDAVESILLKQDQGTILRTSWVIGPVGNNFALNMLKLHKKLDFFSVVSDQIGSPTSTKSLSLAIWELIKKCQEGMIPPKILHWTDAGAASWFDIAVAVGEISKELGIIAKTANIKPIATKDYPTKAARPSYSILDCFESREMLGVEAKHWREALKETLKLHYFT